MASLNGGPGTGHNVILTILYTPLGGIITTTSFKLTFTNADTYKSYYNSSLRLNAGDLIHLHITYSGGNGNTAHDITCQIDLF